MPGHARVARALGTGIVAGRYAQGDVLPGRAVLLARFGVSRTVLREAIKTLAGKGMIETRTRVGTRVRERAAWNLFDPMCSPGPSRPASTRASSATSPRSASPSSRRRRRSPPRAGPLATSTRWRPASRRCGRRGPRSGLRPGRRRLPPRAGRGLRQPVHALGRRGDRGGARRAVPPEPPDRSAGARRRLAHSRGHRGGDPAGDGAAAATATEAAVRDGLKNSAAAVERAPRPPYPEAGPPCTRRNPT